MMFSGLLSSLNFKQNYPKLPELWRKHSSKAQNCGMQYQYLQDMLQIFHPSKITAADLSAKLIKLKHESPQVPLIVGIGGPDECGHVFFVSELTEALRSRNC